MNRSYYLGPNRRIVPLGTWDELRSAAAAGVLDETQWVELKQAVPAASKEANRELARDLASLSVDGGVLVIGIEDADRAAGAVVGAKLEGLATRIDQVARGGITPPLNVAITTVADPEDATSGVVIVEVPASVTAPHMVDGSYWGRGATGKAKLADPDVRRLLNDRDARRTGFEDRLTAVRSDLDPQPANRAESHLYLLLEPQGAPSTSMQAQIGRPIDALAAVLNTLQQRPVYPPSFEGFRWAHPHPDGYLLTNVIDGQATELMLQMVLGDDASIRLVSGRASYERSAGNRFVTAEHVIETAHHAIRAAATLGREHVGFNGQWQLGVLVDQLKGLQASQAAEYGGLALPAFPSDEVRHVVTASTDEMLESTPGVVASLLARFLRGLGIEAMGQYHELDDVIRRRH